MGNETNVVSKVRFNAFSKTLQKSEIRQKQQKTDKTLLVKPWQK